MYSVSLCSCAGPQHGRCSAPAPWQVGKTPLQVRVQCKVLLQSSKCWLVTAALSVCQGNRHTQQSSTITWAEIKSQNDFLRTFLALAGRRNDIYFSAVAVHNPWCDAERAAVKDVLLSGTTFNTLHGASGGLAELVSLKPCSWACCSNIWLWWPERPLLPSQRLYLRIFFCLIAIPFKAFQSNKRRWFCFYCMNLNYAVQGQDLQLSSYSFLPYRENCRLNGVSDLMQPLYSSQGSPAGILTEFCRKQTHLSHTYTQIHAHMLFPSPAPYFS